MLISTLFSPRWIVMCGDPALLILMLTFCRAQWMYLSTTGRMFGESDNEVTRIAFQVE